MSKLKDKLALTDSVMEKAAYIYRKALEKGLIRGRSIEGLVAACTICSVQKYRNTKNIV